MTLPLFITPHFSLAEVEHSDIGSRLGIINKIPKNLLPSVVNTANGMERVRAVLENFPISVSSWFRQPLLNLRVGSTPGSQHLKGEAVDFICPKFGPPAQICKRLVEEVALVNYDQLILEHTWVHISWNSVPGALQRNQVLSLLETRAFAAGITDKKGRSL